MSTKRYDEEDVLKALEALKEETPPMPEDLHERWMEQVRRTPRDAEPTHRRGTLRGLALATAAALVLGGAYLARPKQAIVPAAGIVITASEARNESAAMAYDEAPAMYEAAEEEAVFANALPAMTATAMATPVPSPAATRPVQSKHVSPMEQFRAKALALGCEALDQAEERLTLRVPAEVREALLKEAEALGFAWQDAADGGALVFSPQQSDK